MFVSYICTHFHFQWELEKWKFENKNQVMLYSLVTGKALRIKSDGTVDGLGEERDPGCKSLTRFY
jgi:hypothetical protein